MTILFTFDYNFIRDVKIFESSGLTFDDRVYRAFHAEYKLHFSDG